MNAIGWRVGSFLPLLAIGFVSLLNYLSSVFNIHLKAKNSRDITIIIGTRVEEKKRQLILYGSNQRTNKIIGANIIPNEIHFEEGCNFADTHA